MSSTSSTSTSTSSSSSSASSGNPILSSQGRVLRCLVEMLDLLLESPTVCERLRREKRLPLLLRALLAARCVCGLARYIYICVYIYTCVCVCVCIYIYCGARSVCLSSCAPCSPPGVCVYFTRDLFYVEAVVHESTILSPPPRPPALPTLVQYYCTMI